MFSYFTIKDANEILPVVIKKFKNIVDMKNSVFKIQGELENNPKYISNFQDYVIKKQELNLTLSNFYKAIEDLEIGNSNRSSVIGHIVSTAYIANVLRGAAVNVTASWRAWCWITRPPGSMAMRRTRSPGRRTVSLEKRKDLWEENHLA